MIDWKARYESERIEKLEAQIAALQNGIMASQLTLQLKQQELQSCRSPAPAGS